MNNLSYKDIDYKMPTALIYCRVSSVKQKIEGSGLQSQKHRCLAYATTRGYTVEKIFLESVSGGLEIANRPAMGDLLLYLEQQKKYGKTYVVIFDDHKRFARDTAVHILLRKEIQKRGARVEYLNFSIEDTPEGTFIDTMLAAQSQLEREQIGRQTKEKTKARLEQGFWTFRAPLGYKYVRSKQGGKELVLDEPLASVVKDAFELFAAGRLSSQAEVKRFLDKEPHFPKDSPNGEVRTQTVSRLLDRRVYAGYLEAPSYHVSLRKANHPPLISLETFEKVQKRRRDNGYLPMRKDLHYDFVFRGAVYCASCEKPYRASWTKGNTKLHPYYVCQKKGCSDYGKSIRRDRLDADFEALLKTIQPEQTYIDMVTAMFKNAWTLQLERAKNATEILTKEMIRLEKEIDILLERIIAASNTRVIEAYEKKIATLEKEKMILADNASQNSEPRHSFLEMLELTLTFLANPYKLWEKGSYDMKRTVLKLTFQGSLYYTRQSDARTPLKALTHKLFLPLLQDIKQNGVPDRI